jgi:hypothetical protein
MYIHFVIVPPLLNSGGVCIQQHLEQSCNIEGMLKVYFNRRGMSNNGKATDDWY